jgi:hypothetical protein
MPRNSDNSGRGGPRSISTVLADVVARLGLERDLDDFRVWEAWDEVVGEAVSRNAWPIRLDGHRLVVAVKSNTWMQELAMLRDQITPRLNEWMGREVVREIFLVVGRPDQSAGSSRDRIRRRSGDRPQAAARAVDEILQRGLSEKTRQDPQNQRQRPEEAPRHPHHPHHPEDRRRR